MKNTGNKLLFKYIIMGFLTGAISMIPQLFILSGYISHQRLALLLMNNYTLIALCTIPLFFSFIGFLIARSKLYKLKLSNQLITIECERQVLEQELSEYQYALDLCAITTIIDEYGRIKKVNKNFLSFTGYKIDEIIGRSVWRMPSSLQNPGVFERIKECVNTGNIWTGEIEYYQPNGQKAYTKATVVPLLQQEEDKNDCLVIQYDITSEKNIDLALRKSEKEKSIILSNTQTLICTHNLDGIITNINKAGAEMLGKPIEEIIGKPLQSFLDKRYSTESYLSAITENGISTGYMKVMSGDNKIRTLLYKNVACNEQDGAYIIGSAIDITETLEARKAIDNQKAFMSRMVDESSNMICVLDDENNVSFINKKLKSFFKISDEQEITTLQQAHAHIADFESLTGITSAGGQAPKYSVHECKIAEPDTKLIRWFKVQKTSFSDNNKKNFILIIATDISEKHATQIELIKARQAVETSLKMRENFIANMSHEIRTPLNAIIGFSELLNDTQLNHQQEDYLKTIKVAGQNLLNIINDILDLSKLESGKIQVSKHRLSIDTIVTNVKRLFEPKVQEKNIDIDIDIAHDIPPALLGDEMRLNQVLINLVGNAIKFTNRGKIEIAVKLSGIINGINQIEFQIKDTGIGIDKDKLDVIFQRYAQGSKDIHKLYGGTGLGLSISKSLIELLGGDIKLSSEKGVGTTFSFTLPFEVATDNRKEIQKHFSAKEEVENGALRILLAEDNATNAKLAMQVLKKRNYNVHHVLDGLDVLQALKKNSYDLILMDVQMVHMDGIETTRIIRESAESHKNIPILALTAHSYKGERDICDNAGMNAYLAKPYRPQELLECIEKMMSASDKKSNQAMITVMAA